jgi:hypothetical protein
MHSLYARLLVCTFLCNACTTDATLLSSDVELSLSEDERAAPLSSLDAAEQQQMCRALGEWASSVGENRGRHALCLLAGSVASGLAGPDGAAGSVADCEQVYDACLADEAQAQSEDDEQMQAQACEAQDFSQCDATVAEWAQCQQESTLGLLNALDELTCETAQPRVDASMPTDSPLFPPSCKALLARCPSLLPPEPPPSCAFQLRTAGAVEAELDYTSELCGHSEGSGAGIVGTQYLALVEPPAGAVFKSVAVELPWGFTEHDEQGATVGLVVWTADGASAWETHACSADVTTEACDDEHGEAGLRFRFENGSCSLAATPSTAIPGASGELEILAFSGYSWCVTH